jgi:polyphosphate glucokinase
MMINQNTILGVDIGGTGTKFALVDTAKGILITERYKGRTPHPATPEAVAQFLLEHMAHLNWRGRIGCGLPSIIQKGVAKSAANIDDAWLDLDVEDFLSEKLGNPVKVINDADAAGLAEMKFGRGRHQGGVVLMLTVGTGIGSALFYDGQLVPNTELGHLKFKGGVAEHYASNSAKINESLDWYEWGHRFSELLVHLERVFSPDLFIIGGGMSKRFDFYKDYLFVDTPILPASQDNAAGVIGAALYARIALGNDTQGSRLR